MPIVIVRLSRRDLHPRQTGVAVNHKQKRKPSQSENQDDKGGRTNRKEAREAFLRLSANGNLYIKDTNTRKEPSVRETGDTNFLRRGTSVIKQ